MKTKYFVIVSLFVIRCILLILFINSSSAQFSKFQKWQQPGFFKGFTMSVWDGKDMREVNQEDFDSLKAIGATLVVIETQGSMDVEPPYGPNVYYQEGDYIVLHIEMLDQMVGFARNAELMYVIAVRDGPGRIDVSGQGNSTIWTNPAEQQLYGQMLKEMAARYFPDTLFGGMVLTVEPNPLGELWEPPVSVMDSALRANGIDINAIQSIWIDSIRTIDSDLPLIVGGTHANHPEYFSLMKKQADDKIVYSAHFYNPANYSHAQEPYSVTYPGEYWCVRLDALSIFDKTFLKNELYKPVSDFQNLYNVPIFIGEFGLNTPQNGGQQYLEDIASIACESGWHYAIWGFNNGPNFNYKDLDSIFGTNYWELVKSFMNCDFTPVIESSVENHCVVIYPNPFSDYCEIKSEPNCEIEILDIFGNIIIKGKEVLRWQPEGDYFNSVYFARFKQNNKTYTKPIILLK
ncbi:MAG: cellulase family glycosylhydrolase [Ignavibacteriae bacterium]|nr:cellulase family glycosylhydrolase [Ignavibacteriota bacterium]